MQAVAFGNTNSTSLQDALNSWAGSVVAIPLLDGAGGSGSSQQAHIARTTGFVIERALIAGDNTVACGASIRCIIGTFVDRNGQSVSLVPLDDVTYGDPPQSLEASASSGLPVTFSSSGPCTIAGTTVTIDGAGACQVTAFQAGSEDYLPASATDTFTIARSALMVTAVDTTGRSAPQAPRSPCGTPAS